MSFTLPISERSPPFVLLLHGQPGGGADWGAVVRRLAGGATALAIDRPGWGAAGPARDLEGNAAVARAALDTAGAERAVIVGHSFGGAVAAWLAAETPERVAGLVLVAPAANLASRTLADRGLGIPGLGELLCGASMATAGAALGSARVRRALVAGTGVQDDYLIAARRFLLSPRGWRNCALEQRAWLHDLPALDARLGEVAVPAVVLAGANDRIVGAASAQRLAEQLPDARLLIAPGAGHLLPQTRPALVADTIRATLDSA